MVQSVTLQFPTLETLYRYRTAIGIDRFEVGVRTFQLTCACTKTQIDLAITRYDAVAVVVEKMENL